MSRPFRVAIIEPLPDWIRCLYAPELASGGFEIHWSDGDDAGATLDALGGVEALVTGKRRVTSTMIDAAGSELRLIQVQGRAPWAVDLAAAESAGLSVSFMPHRGAIAVAEHTLALALGIYRKLVPGHLATIGAAYEDLAIEPVETDERTIAFNWMGLEDVSQLYGKVLGLIGLGDIGLEVARRARGFDMDVLYAKRSPIPAEFERRLGFRHVSLEVLVEQADIVSLHVPHTKDTEGIIGSAELAAMKPTAVLINTSRGGLVDENALAECLRDRRIAGAGLDVFRMEPLPAGHPFMGLDNLLLSPHVGGGTGGGQKAMVADVVANLRRVAQGDEPVHLVDFAHAPVWP